MGLLNALFDPLERLINEHGSAAILRERLDLIKAKLTQEEGRYAQLEAENQQLKDRLQEAQSRARAFERELQELKSGHHAGICCDACGSVNVRRTGARPDPTFAVLGVKQGLFTCADCGHVSAFSLDGR